jgi:hypothetical protein
MKKRRGTWEKIDLSVVIFRCWDFVAFGVAVMPFFLNGRFIGSKCGECAD